MFFDLLPYMIESIYSFPGVIGIIICLHNLLIMGRPKNNPFRICFAYNKLLNKSACKLCEANLSGDHGANLEKHIKRHHLAEYERISLASAEIRELQRKESLGKMQMQEFIQTQKCGFTPSQLKVRLTNNSFTQKKKRKVTSQDQQTNLLLERAVQHLHNDKDDEAEILAKSWAVKYRKLTYNQQIYAIKAIDEIFHKGFLGKLNENVINFEESTASLEQYSSSVSNENHESSLNSTQSDSLAAQILSNKCLNYEDQKRYSEMK